MKVLAQTEGVFEVQLLSDEMLVINNALNEVLHGIDVPEFHSRLGVSRDFARSLLDAVGRALDTRDRQ